MTLARSQPLEALRLAGRSGDIDDARGEAAGDGGDSEQAAPLLGVAACGDDDGPPTVDSTGTGSAATLSATGVTTPAGADDPTGATILQGNQPMLSTPGP